MRRSGRCVCSHIAALHKDGVCFASVNPCGCRQFQADNGKDPKSGPILNDDYRGFYAGKRWSA